MQNTITDLEFQEYLDRIADGFEGLEEWERSIRVEQGTALMVFNSNPFTVGHRYLAELASRRSGNVLVLVIQGRPESGGKGNHENTGIVFPFRQRLEMTIKCLEDLENVTVLPSGRYVTGRDDYPSDFLRERMGNVPAHAILDSMVLCHLCGAVGIKGMFAGDEPRDEMSEIHLNALRDACRSNGIALKVAERKRLGDRYISSAMVRDALARGDWREVSLLVPEKALGYLAGHLAGH